MGLKWVGEYLKTLKKIKDLFQKKPNHHTINQLGKDINFNFQKKKRLLVIISSLLVIHD